MPMMGCWMCVVGMLIGVAVLVLIVVAIVKMAKK